MPSDFRYWGYVIVNATDAALAGRGYRTPGTMVFTSAMYKEIDQAISSIKRVATDQLFVAGRVDLLWQQVETQSNNVQSHESTIQ